MGETNVLFSIGPLEVTGAVVTMWVIIAVLALWCPRENIQRLLRGQARKFHWHTGPQK